MPTAAATRRKRASAHDRIRPDPPGPLATASATTRSSRSGRPMAPAYESDSPTSIVWSPVTRRGCVAALAIRSRTSLTRGSSNSAPEETPGSRRPSPDQHSGGEQWPQPLLQRRARKRADNPVDLLPVPDHNEQRDRLRAKPRGESRIRVNVDLHDLQVPGVTFGEVLEHGRDHPTRPAPCRPEIHHHRHGRGRLGRERAGVRVDDPRQRGLAPRASRDSVGDRPDAIARITGRAADNRHHHQGRPRRSGDRPEQPISRLKARPDASPPPREGRASSGRSKPPERPARRARRPAHGRGT